jgi:hypothetical protein
VIFAACGVAKGVPPATPQAAKSNESPPAMDARLDQKTSGFPGILLGVSETFVIISPACSQASHPDRNRQD